MTAVKKPSYYIINSITLYRLVSAPVLLILIFTRSIELFKGLIAFSFLTDAIDGPLARKYKVSSVFGSRLDSIADDATVIVATIAVWIIHPDFIRSEWIIIAALLALFLLQTMAALITYGKTTSFHTYLAKIAAVAQALFFILKFFAIGGALNAFYLAAIITGLQLLEEIVLILMLPEWKANVKGVLWVLRSKKHFHNL